MTRLVPVALLASILLPPSSAAADPDPAQPYTATRSDPVTYDIDFRVIVTAPQGTKTLRVWLPLPPTDRGQEVRPGTFGTFPSRVKPTVHTEPVFGNKFAYFEFDRPQGAQIITHAFEATVWEQRWDVDPAKVTRVDKWPASFGPYRRGESRVVVNDKLKTLADSIAGGKPNPAAELDAILGWAHDHLAYDHTNTSLVASAEHALEKRRGDCSDYHGLCASLGRSLGLVATVYAEADGRPLPPPDPADPTRREFGWMTAHKYTPDRPVPYPFRDWKTLAPDRPSKR